MKPFVSDRSDASAESFASLFAVYCDYVLAGKPRKRRLYDFDDAEYDIETVRAMTSQDEVVWDMLSRLPMPDRDRTVIARSPLKEQIVQLTRWLRAAP